MILPVTPYLKELSRSVPLSRKDEQELANRIRRGDREALHALVRANLKFVVAVAQKYENHGLPLADLIGEGNLGMIRAAQRFDETLGFRFISFAVCGYARPSCWP